MTPPFADALVAYLGEGAGVGFSPIAGPEGVYPEEAPAIARAIPRRQAEFAAGRRAARMALAALGLESQPIAVGPARAPVWPETIVGAITHDCDMALAAVLPKTGALGVGIDLTEAAPLSDQIRDRILPDASEAALTGLEARAGFSAKESLFKALYPRVGSYFGFEAARVAPDVAAGRVHIELTRPLGGFPAGTAWQGGVWQSDGVLLTAFRIGAAPASP